jgi:hypothetical protein
MNPDRRKLLEQGLAVAAVAAVGIGTNCQAAPPRRTSVAASKDNANPSSQVSWTPRIPALPVGGSFDLAGTLPPNVARGGRFGLDSRGAPLPTGMSLSEAGILSVGSAATGKVSGVLFTYEVP